MTTLVLNPTTDTCAQEEDPSGWNDSWGELWINTDANTGGYRCRGLYRFDFGDIPGGATINSAALQLTVKSAGDTKTITVHRVHSNNSGWDGGANWYTCDYANPWAGSYGCGTSGTDYVATAMASLSVSSTGAKTWNLNTTEFASLIAANHGIELLATDGPTYADYTMTYSCEDATESRWPKLTIDYTAGGGVPIAAILNSYRQRRA